jgi:hypothetical protein
MDWGVALFLLIAVGFPGLVVWSWVRGARGIMNAERAYRASLADLRADPTNPHLREETLELGRRVIRLNSRSGVRGGLSELAMTNDINAACAHAVNHPGAVARVAVVNPGALSTDSVAKQIEDLNNLRRIGVLTDEEFERGKALFLGASPDKAAVAVSLLRNLDALRAEGVLTQSEFNIKKWEILSERLIPGRLTAAR